MVSAEVHSQATLDLVVPLVVLLGSVGYVGVNQADDPKSLLADDVKRIRKIIVAAMILVVVMLRQINFEEIFQSVNCADTIRTLVHCYILVWPHEPIARPPRVQRLIWHPEAVVAAKFCTASNL